MCRSGSCAEGGAGDDRLEHAAGAFDRLEAREVSEDGAHDLPAGRAVPDDPPPVVALRHVVRADRVADKLLAKFVHEGATQPLRDLLPPALLVLEASRVTQLTPKVCPLRYQRSAIAAGTCSALGVHRTASAGLAHASYACLWRGLRTMSEARTRCLSRRPMASTKSTSAKLVSRGATGASAQHLAIKHRACGRPGGRPPRSSAGPTSATALIPTRTSSFPRSISAMLASRSADGTCSAPLRR